MIEMMVITFVAIVAFILIASSVTIMIVEIKDPETDTTTITQSLISLISGILGALLGLIAGKTTAAGELSKRPGEDVPSELDDRPR